MAKNRGWVLNRDQVDGAQLILTSKTKYLLTASFCRKMHTADDWNGRVQKLTISPNSICQAVKKRAEKYLLSLILVGRTTIILHPTSFIRSNHLNNLTCVLWRNGFRWFSTNCFWRFASDCSTLVSDFTYAILQTKIFQTQQIRFVDLWLWPTLETDSILKLAPLGNECQTAVPAARRGARTHVTDKGIFRIRSKLLPILPR